MTSIEKYNECKSSIEKSIEILQKKLIEHELLFENDNTNWGYVGDISYLDTKLENIVESVKNWK